MKDGLKIKVMHPGYSLSVGKFNKKNNTLSVNQTMVNPYTSPIFYVMPAKLMILT